jgi:hypothetical protein
MMIVGGTSVLSPFEMSGSFGESPSSFFFHRSSVVGMPMSPIDDRNFPLSHSTFLVSIIRVATLDDRNVEGNSLKGGGSRGHCSSLGAGNGVVVEEGRWARWEGTDVMMVDIRLLFVCVCSVGCYLWLMNPWRVK